MQRIDKALAEFEHDVLKAVTAVCKLMEERTTIDYLEYILDSIFFRNCHIFETISFLLGNNYLIGAEYLLRNLLEGTVLLEWCLVDPKERGLRFCKTVFEGELELINTGFFTDRNGREYELRDALKCCNKGLPDFRSMLESLKTYRKDSAYNMYKCLSKDTHGVSSNWSDFLDCSGKKVKVGSVTDPPPSRVRNCRAIISYLAMNNITRISSFDVNLHYGKCHDLETKWERIYARLWIHEQLKGV